MFMSGCQLLPTMEPMEPAVLVALVGPLWLITLKPLAMNVASERCKNTKKNIKKQGKNRKQGLAYMCLLCGQRRDKK